MSAGWWQVRVEVPVDELDVVSGRLWAAGVAGVEERPGTADGRVLLVVGVEASHLATVRIELGDRTIEIVEIDPETGLDEWRAFATEIEVGTLVVRPAWLPPTASASGSERGGVTIVLDPGRAFGSGAHVTTRLALQLLQDVDVRGRTVLDVGCGSGVLTVAAALLGAATVTAVDVDPEARRVTLENVTRNGVGDRVVVAAAIDEVASQHDVVAANITAEVLVQLAPKINERVRGTGRVALTGLLADQRNAVLDAYRPWTPCHEVAEGAWLGVVLSR